MAQGTAKVRLQIDAGNLVGRGRDPKCYVAASGFVGRGMVSIPRKNDTVSTQLKNVNEININSNIHNLHSSI